MEVFRHIWTHLVFYRIHICYKLFIPDLDPSLEVPGQGRVELLQALKRHPRFLAVPDPGQRRPQSEPSSRELRFEAHRLPVRGDGLVQPTAIAVSLPKKKKRDKGCAADGTRALQGPRRLPRLPGQPLSLAEQNPGADVLRVALDYARKRRGRLRILAAAQPGVARDHPPVGTFGIPALPFLGVAQ